MRTNANVWDSRYGETRTRLTLSASVSLCQFQQVSICAQNITARTFSTVEHVNASHRFISQPVCGDHTVVIRSRFGEKTYHSSLSRSTSNSATASTPTTSTPPTHTKCIHGECMASGGLATVSSSTGYESNIVGNNSDAGMMAKNGHQSTTTERSRTSRPRFIHRTWNGAGKSG